MQAKDIPTRSVLESVKRHHERGSIYQIWDDFPDVPFKVLRAKMNRLGKQRLVNCCCNECSGWISLTPEGAAMLAPKHLYVVVNDAHYSDSGQEK